MRAFLILLAYAFVVRFAFRGGGCEPAELGACRDSLAALRSDMRCVADAIPLSRWGHVMGTLYAARPDTGACGIIYRDNLTGVVWVDRRPSR